ncbi:alkaline phosphatase [Scytonema sp. UIC 10036]|uniref:alkaline phosphatase D family protein n=1 Tax=Scytonema sp. UIC 10036 TaxID=2304196 RepID=UPI0012DA283D|nr:alkaline phosphatase [Scytonema sp. UIC 10036]MUG95194.1 alkaline phosphatase [Scytonema sp. UIC 10036]
MNSFNFERMRSHQIKRRQVLIGASVLTGLAASNHWHKRVVAQPVFSAYPFSLGVASGDPLPDSVVLWTRLAPDPLNGGGMPSANVPVQWQIAADENMRQVVYRGTEMAVPKFGHSVHVEVGGLQPARWYWYQFKVGNEVSQIGRTRTTPKKRDRVKRFRFAFASCQNWEEGFYTAYKYMAKDELDLVVHLGDYIYEGPPSATAVRPHEGTSEPVTLFEYRNRYAQYKGDSNLQAAHAAFPWIVTWDDHEVDNNYANDIPQDPEQQSRKNFLARRVAAYQAYYEHMPLRRFSIPTGANMQLYRRLSFGSLVEFNVLDTRQYRTDQPCNDGTKPRCPSVLAPNATLTGAEQERWLFDGLKRSRARWNVLAQQVLMSQVDRTRGPEQTFSMDMWAGYVAQRNRILRFLQESKISNPIVLTGDIHSNWVSDLKTDFDNPESPVVGTEFVGTSISSGGDGSDTNPRFEPYLPENPWIKFYNSQRGYVRCDITPERWQSDYRVMAAVTTPDAPMSTRASFVVEDGQPGAQQV